MSTGNRTGQEIPFDLSSRLLELDGAPYLRGLMHGETFRSLIMEGVRIWKDVLGRAVQSNPEEYLAGFLEFTNYTIDIQLHSPDLWEEVKGISVGSGIDFNTILAYQLIDEEWWYRSVIHAEKSLHGGTGCSVLAVNANQTQPVLLAQNMDLVDYVDGGQVLLHIQQDGLPGCFVFTLAGMVALNGMNRNGLGVCCNQLVQLESARSGLPVAFIIRKVLQQPDLLSAGNFLTHTRHASGQNYTIGSPEGIAGYECSAHQVSEYHPQPGTGWLCHTNHPLVNTDTHTFDTLPYGYTSEERAALHQDTTSRLAFMQKELQKRTQHPDPDVLRGILSSQETPICKTIDPDKDQTSIGAFTFGCAIMTLTTQPFMDICFGPPSVRPFFRLGFDGIV